MSFIKTLFFVIFGNILYAFSVKLFILPTDLMSSGTTGIALFMNHYFNVPITVFIISFNICMFLIGYWILGKKFAMTTIVSSITYPVVLEILNRTMGDFVITQDILLNTIFASIGLGSALGIVVKNGASTGGMDIPPLVLHHFFRFPVSISLSIFDCLILLSQSTYHPLEMLLYGILLVLLTSVVLDKVLLFGTTKIEVKIISSKVDEIAKEILSDMDRGVTLLNAKGGYTKEQNDIILSVVSNRELPKVERMINAIDPDAFIIVSHVSEVWGHGFSSKKQYK